MNINIPKELSNHISFNYVSFDRVVLRGYIQGLFVAGSVINMLRNLGFKKHSNVVLRILTDQLNSHIKKTSQKLGVEIHWWGVEERNKYHSKIDLIQDKYKSTLQKKNKKSKVIAIIRAVENVRTFANKEITTKSGKKFTKMYSVNKFVSQYYIYIDDEQLGLCYLKLSSYIPLVSEFYFNGHNYLKKQFDIQGKTYTMKDNSFTKVEDIDLLNNLVEGNSIKCYNKSGCLLRVETTINKPDLPGLKLKKPAINLLAYFRYGFSSNNRYIETIGNIDISNFDDGTMRKYQESILNSKGVRVAAPDLRKEHQVELLLALLLTKNRVFGFRNKDLQQILGNNWKTAKIAYELRKLRERGAIKKMKQSHYYQLTREGYEWIFFSIFQNQHFVKPLISGNYKTSVLGGSDHKDKTEQAYSDIKQSVSIIMNQFALVS